jgi:MerR family redox-sensitive transcriptional activator SoxR
LKSRKLDMNDATLTIGQVARQVGLNTSAIRYYESVGVLPEPARLGGQRRYTPETVQRLRVIDVAKRAGFSLDEARLLLDTQDAHAPAHEQIRELAQRKLPEVDALIARAQAMRQWLSTATGCHCNTLDVCGLFDPEAAPTPGPSTREVALNITHVGA